jgi:hypothetical protein
MPLIPADDVAERGTKAWRQQVDSNRLYTARQLWTAQANGMDMSDPNARAQVLAGLGITDEQGGGRHAYNLFQGNLGSEGFGMSSFRDLPYAMEAYMPDWRFNLDRAIQGGMPRGEANSIYLPAGTPGSAGYPGAGGASTTSGAASFAAPSAPSVAGPGSSEGASGSGVPMGYNDDDAWRRARLAFKSRRMSLGSLGGL